jgi:hypothetical protein
MAMTQQNVINSSSSSGMFSGQGINNNNSLLDTFSKPLVVNSLDQLNHQMS